MEKNKAIFMNLSKEKVMPLSAEEHQQVIEFYR